MLTSLWRDNCIAGRRLCQPGTCRLNLSLRALGLLLGTVYFLCIPLQAEDWYVDNSLSSSSNIGASWTNAWTNFASINWTKVQPGDSVWISGGTTGRLYRESLSIGRSGAPGQPIFIRKAIETNHNGQVIIDGADVITNTWIKCASEAEADGNPNWQHLYYTRLDAAWYPNALEYGVKTYTTNYGPVCLNLWQGTNGLSLCQLPKSEAPLYQTVTTVHQLFYATTNITSTNLGDARLEDLGGARLTNAFAWLWVIPNLNYPSKIRDYDPTTRTITFDSSVVYTSPGRFAIVNELSRTLTRPGEFYLDADPDSNGRYRLFVWPHDEEDIRQTQSIKSSRRNDLLSFAGKSYLTVEGLTMRYTRKTAVFTSSFGSTDLTLRHCQIHGGLSHGTSLIYLLGVKNLVVEHCHIHDTRWNQMGLQCGGRGATNIVFRSNVVERASLHGIFVGAATNILIEANTFRDCLATHGNAIAAFGGSSTLPSRDVTIRRNLLLNNVLPITMTESIDTLIDHNIVVGSSSYVFRENGGVIGTLAFYNNVLLTRGKEHYAIGYVYLDTNKTTLLIRNNIVDGITPSTPAANRSGNIYTGLNAYMKSSEGFYLGSGDLVQTNLAAIFAEPEAGDYRPRADGPAMGGGTNLGAPLQRDFLEQLHLDNGPWSIGAYAGPNPSAAPADRPPSPRNLQFAPP